MDWHAHLAEVRPDGPAQTTKSSRDAWAVIGRYPVLRRAERL